MAKSYEGDYQFGEASQFDKSFRGLGHKIRSDALKPLAMAFQLNMERVVSMNCLPIEMIHWAGFAARAYCVARHDLGLHPTDETKDQWPEMANAVEIASGAMMSGRHSPIPGDEANRAWADGTRFLKGFLRGLIETQKSTDLQTKEYLTGGLEAILASMITLSYAAFETLCSDLWIEALNADSRLAENWARRNPRKELRMEDLIGHRFDLSRSMGSALIQTQKAAFVSLNEIMNNFRDAFDGKADHCFEPRDSLVEVEKVRHLFAHRGGVVDQKFVREMADYSHYANLPIGRRLPMTGPDACRCIDACVSSGARLLNFVDDRLNAPRAQRL